MLSLHVRVDNKKFKKEKEKEGNKTLTILTSARFKQSELLKERAGGGS